MVRHKNRILKKKLKEKNIFSQSKKHKFVRKKKDANEKYNKKKKKLDDLSISNYKSTNTSIPQKRKKNNELDKPLKVPKKNVVNVIKKKYEESSSGEEEDEQTFIYNTLLGSFNKNMYSKSAVSSESEEETEEDEDIDHSANGDNEGKVHTIIPKSICL